MTIQVIGCQNLTAKHSDITKIAPFFYYQFYTFDEKYSKTSVGSEPAFDDTEREYWAASATLVGLSLHWRALRHKLGRQRVS